jgi:hypothetical protein
MIGPPKRSVTRFFIPLIDVLILLFCMFLLIPFADKEAVGSTKLTRGEVEQLRQKIASLEQKIIELEAMKTSDSKLVERIAELEDQALQNIADRVVIKTFNVHPLTGELSYLDAPDGGRQRLVALKDAEAADKLITRHIAELIGGDKKKELKYLLLRPQGSLAPDAELEEEYRTKWFRRVKMEIQTVPLPPGTGESKP